MKLLLKNAKVVTFNEKNEILEGADILIRDRKIEKIGYGISAEADKVMDCSGKLIMPGLINSHLHSDENMFRGLFDNLPLEPWMLYSCPPLMYGPFSARLIYLRTIEKAYENGYQNELFFLVFLGILTGVGGGVIRDVLAQKTPLIFRKQIYACASLIGALFCALCMPFSKDIAMVGGTCLVIAIRLLAVMYHWNLPKMK